MFLFRAVFIIVTVFVTFVAHATPIPPLTRFMLDAIPEGAENGADPNTNAVAADPSAPPSPHAEVPTAADSSPVSDVQLHSSSSEAEPSASSSADNAVHSNSIDDSETASSSDPASDANTLVAQTNGALSRVGRLGSTGILLGSIVAGIVLA